MATSLRESKKRGPGRSSTYRYISFGEKIVNIGPVNPEIISFRETLKSKKKEITHGKIYNPVGKFAEWAK